jgi:hypothetical protein
MKLVYEHKQQTASLTLHISPEEHSVIVDSTSYNDTGSIILRAIEQLRLELNRNCTRCDLQIHLTAPLSSR